MTKKEINYIHLYINVGNNLQKLKTRHPSQNKKIQRKKGTTTTIKNTAEHQQQNNHGYSL